MDKTRRGVVLFITLSVIAAMLALVGVIFSYLEKSKGDASYTAAMIQANLLLHDSNEAIKLLLKNAGKDKDTKETILSMLYLAPMTLQPATGEMFVTIECTPLARGVNINWLAYENNETLQPLYEMAQKIFDSLAEQYDISNASLLLSMIKAELDVEESSFPDNPSRLMQKKGIISLVQFQRIVREYQFKADDREIGRILWEKFFSFDKDAVLLDGNYFSAELVSLLFEMELAIVKEEWFEGDDLRAFLLSHGADISLYDEKLYAKSATERMHCRVSYGHQEETYAFGFDYLEGKVERFEFYAKQ